MDFTTMLHEINKIDKKVLDHAHIHGFRPSIQFEQKQNYSFEELLIIINSIDAAWETHIQHPSRAVRFETAYIQ